MCAVLRRWRYKLHLWYKTLCKRLYVAISQQGKAGQNKIPAPSSSARQKKSPASVGGVGIIYFFLQDLQGRRKDPTFLFSGKAHYVQNLPTHTFLHFSDKSLIAFCNVSMRCSACFFKRSCVLMAETFFSAVAIFIATFIK